MGTASWKRVFIARIKVPAANTATAHIRSNLLGYETGYYGAADVRRLGIGMLLLTMIVIFLTIPYWNMLGRR